MSKEYLRSADNSKWFDVKLEPGITFGPLYYIGRADFEPRINTLVADNNEKQTFVGLQKPENKIEAEKLYNLKKYGNPMEWIHRIWIDVSSDTHDSMIFVSHVDGGTGIQVNLNRVSASLCRVESKWALPG